ncbi:hypothetical protein PYW08_007497 [Mythimna loreyi]|uniref:Uncharacterized protein n=1 Tax=Mythimna loreyi TaxID=667449 RepID=A0ACC2QGY7_9NEOP|nr:hypothetical protein PYW08_007497 [Mythimna loreyi]
MESKPWWYRYRKRKYRPRNRLSLEMILRKSLVETAKEYIDTCSIAGMKHIIDPNYSVFLRFFWVGSQLSCLGIVIYFLQFTWVATLTKPLVVTEDSFTFPIKDIDFPAVALCNINRISRKALKKVTVEMYPKLRKLNSTLTNLEYFLLNMGRLIDFDYDQSWPQVKLIDLFDSEEYGDQVVDIMKALAPSCDEMLIKCTWAGKEVDCKSIFQVRRTILGHCCAFNYVLDYDSADKPLGTIAEIKRQIIPGSNNGLRVIADSMLDDYAYPLTYRNGFEILIFDPTHFADITGGRVLQRTVQPNQAEFFQIASIKQVASAEVRKYPLKTRKCLFRDEYSQEFTNMYSYSACIVKCRIQSVQSLCKCTPYFMPTEKLQYLYPIDTEDTEGLEQELADSLLCPQCLPDCELTQHFTKSFKVPLPDELMKKRGFANTFMSVILVDSQA